MAEYVDFLDGTIQRARVNFINPKGQPIEYTGKFYLAAPSNLNLPVNVPEVKSFTVAALGSVNVDYNVGIPLLSVAQAELVACLQVIVGVTPVATFVGVKLVRVTFAPSVEFGGIVWNP